jgi:hypothetical protein
MQLKQQLASRHTTEEDTDTRAASTRLEAVDVEIKSNDASKAELALSTARCAVEKLVYARHDRVKSTRAAEYGSLNLRA